MFVRRREEHKTLLDHFHRTEKYDRKFKLLDIGINQIVAVLRENRQTLAREQYSGFSQGFPTTSTLIDAVTLVLENTCLIGDIILHMPDMSEMILSRDKDWREMLDWAVEFTKSFDGVIDGRSMRMLSLFEQEIHRDKRTADYTNPYREKEQPAPTPKKRTKEKKKLKKGPQLHSAGRTEL